MNPKIKQESHKWAEVFVEIALRAIRRVHYEYGIWGIGRQWKMRRENTKKINMAHGIELADEPSVCAAITQEFMNSPSVAGLWEDKGQIEDMYFGIEREIHYTFDKDKRVDIFLQKFKRNKIGDLVPDKDKLPSFIEAKRACLWSMNLSTGKVTGPSSQHGAVKTDIEKLREEMNYRGAHNYDPVLCHVLVWGVYKEDSEKLCSPIAFFEKVGDSNIQLHKRVKWLPLVWDVSGKEGTNINVTRSLWIALAEVNRDTN